MPNDINNPQNPFTPFSNANNDQDLNITDNQNNSNPQPQQNTVQNKAAEEDYPQDERIVEYLIREVIPARNPDMPADQLVKEKDRLYKMLENGIFETAYSQLSDEHKGELDTLMKYGADIPAIQAFFIEKIPNIQVQLGNFMAEFVKKYLNGEI